MSQTLSLTPGEYALFIVPPVAGVDYTGTPLPTVSYQWKKNGTAIAGETNATIGGVRVEQSGGTVSLVDGDVISIDIILTNVVDVSTKTISATIDSAIPAPVISPVSIRQLSGGTYQTVTSLANTDIGEQVIVASNTGGTVTTTPPVLTTYQWRRNFIAIEGATSQTYTLQAADADSIIECRVTATNSGGTSIVTASVVVGTVADAGGWTALTPSSDSRIVYIANNGNDVAAASVYGRGYYLPGDSEVGADPTQPVGAVVAYRNPQEALKVLRGTGLNNVHPGFPEWILFRRGNTFPDSILNGNYTYWGGATPSFGSTTSSFWTWAWTGSSFSYEAGLYRGRSATEPFVISAWGPVSEPRPVFPDGFFAKISNSVVASIDVQNRSGLQYIATTMLIEDSRSQGHGMISVSYGGPTVNLTLRRCVFTDGWNPGGHNSAPFLGVKEGTRITFEECVFDRNGYKENPNAPQTWTASHVSLLTAGQLPVGTGVQPTRTWFDRNWYLSGQAGRTLRVRGNIAARTGGGAEQFRSGGVAERNLFLFGHNGIMASSSGNGGEDYGVSPLVAKGNVHLHDDAMLPPGGYGMNNEVRGSAGAYWIDNIYAHAHHYGQNGGGTLHVLGSTNYTPPDGWRAVVQGNVIRSAGTLKGWGIEAGAFANNAADVRNNAIAIDSPPSWLGASPTATPRSSDTIDGNLYFGNPAANRFSRSYAGAATLVAANTTFAQWQAAGYDPNGQMIADWAAFKAAAGWTDPDRDIVSYMQSIDPTYVPDEDVRVDFGCSGPLQEVPQLVRNAVIGTDAQKRQVARRFHATVTFLNRARENRKGAWDQRYTAEAVVNYIRAGLGKPALTGPYDSRDIEDMAGDYLA